MKQNPTIDNLEYEKLYLSKGYRYICGVDEVGRGPLAGDVTVCAVIMDLTYPIEGITDSKKISEKKREALFPLILSRAIAYKIVSLDNIVIDKINILEATKRAMEMAISELEVTPDIVLIDAVKLNIGIELLPIIKGDYLSYTIACASILAKVTRDRRMIELENIYPGYNFKKNKGYGSAEHIAAIQNLGVTPIHRKTFLRKLIDDVDK